MLDRLVYWLALGAITLIRTLPLAACFALGQAIGAFLWAILPRYRKLAMENLSAAFVNEKTPAEIRRLTFRHFTTLGANGVCAFKFAVLPQRTILRVAPFVNSEVVERNILSGRGVVLAISHMGSWELYAQAAFQRPETRFGTVYQALRNRHLDELINRDRRKGVETLIGKKASKLQSPCCGGRDPPRCWWIRARATGESGCPFSTASARTRRWPPPWPFVQLRGGAGSDLHLRLCALADRLRRGNPLRSKEPGAADGGYQRRSRTADPPIARGLVLGSQPLEDAVAEPSHCQTKARDLSASWLRPRKALSFSLRRALAQLAR